MLEQAEMDFNLRSDRDGLAVLEAGVKAPLVHRFDRLLVEAQSDTLGHAHIARAAAWIDLDRQQHGTGILRFAAFFGIFGFDLVPHRRLAASAAWAVHIPAEST